MTTMAERRQLLIEIDRTFKLIAEGLDSFDEKLEAMKAAPNKQHKEKHMAELKEELKKLQRYRAKVMSWTTCKEVKDKRAVFEDQRLIIETRMETYREMERADKTKPFSEKALEAEPKIDPIQRDHEEVFQWLRHTISILQTQMEPWEAELERLSAESTGGRMITAKIEDLRLRISQNQQHVAKLELIMRYLHNDSIEFQEVKDLRETVETYVESQRESRCAVDIDYLDIYDDILEAVRENDQLQLPIAQGNQAPGALNTATSIDDLEEETHEPMVPYHRQLASPTDVPVSPFSVQPHKRQPVPLPNCAIEEHGPIHSHHHHDHHQQHHRRKVYPKSNGLSHSGVVPAPTPPPLSVPYSQVAAAKVQQSNETDFLEMFNDTLGAGICERDGAGSPPIDLVSRPPLSSADLSEEESSETSDSSDQKQTSPIVEFPLSVSSAKKASISVPEPMVDDHNGNFVKTPSAMDDLKISIDGNYSSTDDMLALVSDPDKLNLITHQATTTDLSALVTGDLQIKKAYTGRAMPVSLQTNPLPIPIEHSTQPKSIAQDPIGTSFIGDRVTAQNGSCFKMPPVSTPSYIPRAATYGTSGSNLPMLLQRMTAPWPPAPLPTRIPKLPYAFNGAVQNGGSDADEAYRNKDEVLKILDVASKRMPQPDNSMRSGHRRLWREQNFQGGLNPNYPIQQRHNFSGIGFTSRLYYATLADETLMFIFYYIQGTLAHRYAIECLEDRGWMWHTQRMQWFKHETADVTALRQQMERLDKKNDFVAGSFKYFDYEKWEERLAPPDFVFQLEFWKTLYNWENVGQRRSMIWTKGDGKVGVKKGSM